MTIGPTIGFLIIIAVISFLLGLKKKRTPRKQVYFPKKPKAPPGPSHKPWLLSDTGTLKLQDWAILATGDSGWKEIEEAWLRKAQEIYGVFCKKQSDYGPTNIAVAGQQGVAIRLGDKLSRFFELLGLTSRENAGEAKNEAIRDSWIDFGDYGIIGLMVHDGDWPLISPDEVWGKKALATLVIDMVGDDPEAIRDLINRLLAFDLAKTIADDIGGVVKHE
jgi:hypothetical protein